MWYNAGSIQELRVQSERRVVTVLFCDVVGSTAIAERLDPEDWTELMNEAFERLNGPLERYEGTVARLLGDAFLAVFGAPVAHEGDAERAVLAGLEMVRAIVPLSQRLKGERGIDFQVRVGINTGPVIVGGVGPRASDYTAMGDAVNLAARMEQTAQPGTVQIAEATHRLVWSRSSSSHWAWWRSRASASPSKRTGCWGPGLPAGCPARGPFARR